MRPATDSAEAGTIAYGVSTSTTWSGSSGSRDRLGGDELGRQEGGSRRRPGRQRPGPPAGPPTSGGRAAGGGRWPEGAGGAGGSVSCCVSINELTIRMAWVAGLALVALLLAGWRKTARAQPKPPRDLTAPPRRVPHEVVHVVTEPYHAAGPDPAAVRRRRQRRPGHRHRRRHRHRHRVRARDDRHDADRPAQAVTETDPAGGRGGRAHRRRGDGPAGSRRGRARPCAPAALGCARATRPPRRRRTGGMRSATATPPCDAGRPRSRPATSTSSLVAAAGRSRPGRGRGRGMGVRRARASRRRRARAPAGAGRRRRPGRRPAGARVRRRRPRRDRRRARPRRHPAGDDRQAGGAPAGRARPRAVRRPRPRRAPPRSTPRWPAPLSTATGRSVRPPRTSPRGSRRRRASERVAVDVGLGPRSRCAGRAGWRPPGTAGW